MLKIGEFSRLSRISVRMLRHYDEIGLLAPDTVDPETGYRYYSEEQLAAASRITALREMDFSLWLRSARCCAPASARRSIRFTASGFAR